MTSVQEELLAPLQAALHLAITPELLFGYTRTTFRKSITDAHRLETVQLDGKTLFRRAQLEEFDEYLKEPWAPVGSVRTDPPKCILDHLRAESGNQCARCGSGVGIQTAHIDPWATSRSHHPLNLIRICSRCHVEHDLHNSLPTEELRSLKNALVERMRAFMMRRLEPVAVRFRPPPATGKFVGYADALAGLRRGLQSGRSIFVLGVAGIGKTQLALRALQDLDTGRPVVWISVESFGSPADVVLALDSSVSDGQTPHGPDWLAGRLDELQACVVFDGIERVGTAMTDQFEDILAGLVEKTTRTQFLFTSQLSLQRVPADGSVRLSRLDPVSSGRLLSKSTVLTNGADPETEELLAFCDGHPLTIRLVGALVDFFGSTKTALSRIRKQGSGSIKLHGRSSHDSQTSLELSLALAYEALEPDEKKLLWLVANAPAGLLSAHLEVRDGYGLQDPVLAIARLRNWNLIRSIHAGESNERSYALSPVRSFVARRWRAEFPDDAETALDLLLVDFALMAKVIDDRATEHDGIAGMLERYREELPNLLKVVECARERPSDDQRAHLAYALCGSLMRYFFLLGSAEKGARVMREIVDLAMRRGEYDCAADFIVRMITLAKREGDRLATDAASELLDLMEKRIASGESAETANIAVARAMIAQDAGDWQKAELFAATAVHWHERATPKRMNENSANDLSDALALLGDAQLAQRRYPEAEATYRRALQLGSASHMTVNRGQLLHQIGNGAAYQGNWTSAAQHYVEAAHHFHQVGMHEYLGNALGELGFVTSMLDGIDVPEAVLADGLVDVANSVIRAFCADLSVKSVDRRGVFRKFLGTVMLASFQGSPSLDGFAARIRAELQVGWQREGAAIREGEISILHSALTIAEGVDAMFRLADPRGEEARSATENIAIGVYHLDDFDEELEMIRWFARYLSRRGGRPEITEYKLRGALDEAEQSGVFSLDE